MLTSISSFSFSNFSNSSFKRAFAVQQKSCIDQNLKDATTKSWDDTFDAFVKNLVKELEPNNYEKIMATPEPEFEQIFGGASSKDFNSDVFMGSMLESIAKLSSHVKIPQKYANAISILAENHSESEIENAIKTVLPTVE